MYVAVLRIFQQTSEKVSVRSLAKCVGDSIASAGYRLFKTEIRPYWKNPEYFEIVLELETDKYNNGFDSALSMLGTGWLRPRPYEAIWNFVEGATFIDKYVRWVHFQHLE